MPFRSVLQTDEKQNITNQSYYKWVKSMGLFSIFKKKVYYFDRNIIPQCAYCEYGRRTKDGRGMLCEKQGLTQETASCKKFLYAPLKRVPTKQLNIEGLLAEDEDIYVALPDEVLEAMELPEMPDEMKAPEITDALKAPELPDALKQAEAHAEVLDILKETEDSEISASTEIKEHTLEEIPGELPPGLENVPEVPDIPDVPDVPDTPGNPDNN